MARLPLKQKMHLVTLLILHLYMMESMFTMLVLLAVAGSTCQTTTANPSKMVVNSKKRKVRDDTFSDLVDQIGKFGNVFEGVRQEIKEIATFFRREAEEKDRTRMLFNALAELDEFNTDEMLEAGEAICKEPRKIEFFFGLPMDVRREYVRKQLTESMCIVPHLIFKEFMPKVPSGIDV